MPMTISPASLICSGLRSPTCALDEEDEEVEEEVGGFGNDLGGIAAHCGDDDLDRLFAELLRDAGAAAGEQAGGVGAGRVRAAAGADGGFERVERVHAGVGAGGRRARQYPSTLVGEGGSRAAAEG